MGDRVSEDEAEGDRGSGRLHAHSQSCAGGNSRLSAYKALYTHTSYSWRMTRIECNVI